MRRKGRVAVTWDLGNQNRQASNRQELCVNGGNGHLQGELKKPSRKWNKESCGSLTLVLSAREDQEVSS